MLGSSPQSGKGTFCMFDDTGCSFNHNPGSANHKRNTLPGLFSVCNQCFVKASNYFLSFCKVLGQQTITSAQHLKISLEKFQMSSICHTSNQAFFKNLQWLLFKGKIYFPIPKSLERTRSMFTNCRYDGDVSDNSILPSPCSGIVNTRLWQTPQSIKRCVLLTAASPGIVTASHFLSLEEHRSRNFRITSQLMEESLTGKNTTFWEEYFQNQDYLH